MNTVCILIVPVTLPHLFLLRFPYSLRHNNIETRPINSPAMASKCLSERKSHIPLNLDKELEMSKPSEEGT
jgi:hypothetical protein